MPDIKQSRILIMASDGFEQSELRVPLQKLKDAGATVHVATPDNKPIKGWNQKDWGETVKPDRAIAGVSAADYDALVLPGGQINPDVLRLNETAVGLVREFASAGKVVAAWLVGEGAKLPLSVTFSLRSVPTWGRLFQASSV